MGFIAHDLLRVLCELLFKKVEQKGAKGAPNEMNAGKSGQGTPGYYQCAGEQ